MKPHLTIVMDDRERSPAIHDTLAAMPDVVVLVRRLPLGDFRVGDQLIVERKTLRDFGVSVVDGRFFGQMENLAASSRKGVLILEGGSRDLQKCGVRREALQGALIYATLILGIGVLRAMEPAETARLMVYAARQMALADAGAIKRGGRRPRGKRKRQLFLLQGLPGVGPARAARLLDHFGSVRNALTADPEALTEVAGIGDDLARRIHMSVSESVAAYGDVTNRFFEI